MKIEELENAPAWLLDAKTHNADVEIINGVVHWRGGTWYDGTWCDGVWHSGTWYDGVWHDGEWWSGTWHEGGPQRARLLHLWSFTL